MTLQLTLSYNHRFSGPFLDFEVAVLNNGQIEVAVYRKDTHTKKYLAFDSHNPKQIKAAVVKTLLDRAHAIPSNEQSRHTEGGNVMKDL